MLLGKTAASNYIVSEKHLNTIYLANKIQDSGEVYLSVVRDLLGSCSGNPDNEEEVLKLLASPSKGFAGDYLALIKVSKTPMNFFRSLNIVSSSYDLVSLIGRNSFYRLVDFEERLSKTKAANSLGLHDANIYKNKNLLPALNDFIKRLEESNLKKEEGQWYLAIWLFLRMAKVASAKDRGFEFELHLRELLGHIETLSESQAVIYAAMLEYGYCSNGLKVDLGSSWIARIGKLDLKLQGLLLDCVLEHQDLFADGKLIHVFQILDFSQKKQQEQAVPYSCELFAPFNISSTEILYKLSSLIRNLIRFSEMKRDKGEEVEPIVLDSIRLSLESSDTIYGFILEWLEAVREKYISLTEEAERFSYVNYLRLLRYFLGGVCALCPAHEKICLESLEFYFYLSPLSIDLAEWETLGDVYFALYRDALDRVIFGKDSLKDEERRKILKETLRQSSPADFSPCEWKPRILLDLIELVAKGVSPDGLKPESCTMEQIAKRMEEAGVLS